MRLFAVVVIAAMLAGCGGAPRLDSADKSSIAGYWAFGAASALVEEIAKRPKSIGGPDQERAPALYDPYEEAQKAKQEQAEQPQN